MSKKLRILIVDDEITIRTSLSDYFRMKGYDVEIAENGKAALQILSTIKVNLIISDIVMPIMNGVELLREVREQYPMMRVIMITGYVTLDNALACMRYGADACIFKPLEDLTELEIEVKQASRILQNWNSKLNQLVSMKTYSTGRGNV